MKPMKHDIPLKVNHAAQALLAARSHDPFAYLGLHQEGAGWVIRVFAPHHIKAALFLDGAWAPLTRILSEGLFEWRGATAPAAPYRIQLDDGHVTREVHDPYCFPNPISEHDLYLFGEGRFYQAYRMLGAQPMALQGVQGVSFAVWAPNAERVSVVGDFNRWDGRAHPMRTLGASGVWQLFIPDLAPGCLYKFEIRNRHTGNVFVKTDPYAQAFELRPSTAARVAPLPRHEWSDAAWLERRKALDWLHAPCNIYEMQIGSWRRHPDGRVYSYRELAEHLVPYVKEMGYTHIELMPLSEHPLDESWGYQATGYFAPTSRYGAPDDLRAFIDACHQSEIGVILDWVPAHFPRDDWALAQFDGTALFEHADPRLGTHQDWGTLIFNYGRREVKSFLLASAHYWLNEFHIDGIRVDAVASMLYLDYSRKEGEWLPNRFGGRENLEAIEFLRDFNVMVHEQFPGALTMAEESTSWPMVSRPTYLGGLGFSMKWNMGWMNDTLSYFEHDPVHRRFHHNQLTFGQLYSYTENFVLPFSHDEVVHGKRSLLDKMPGDAWQKFANLRLLFTYQATYPGKKLNFMGNELAQGQEWGVGRELDWWLLARDWHKGIQTCTRDLNHLYRNTPALHDLDFTHEGFHWIDCHDADQSTLSYVRRARSGEFVVVALNFTPVPRKNYRLGVPRAGVYRELFNSDSSYYGGGNLGNGSGIEAKAGSWMGYPASVNLTLPPMAGIILVLA
ncbi:MAG: 1,4-alpha-glucan branching enzyme [Betaproteobacteria bacterium RBG_19FT_COMBO_58_11]|nr:MAG: 1,4-alpha-glucan branching enzyme [Betaproteobacteria bacterium RBG_19FT_COMBO_58_11]